MSPERLNIINTIAANLIGFPLVHPCHKCGKVITDCIARRHFNIFSNENDLHRTIENLIIKRDVEIVGFGEYWVASHNKKNTLPYINKSHCIGEIIMIMSRAKKVDRLYI